MLVLKRYPSPQSGFLLNANKCFYFNSSSAFTSSQVLRLFGNICCRFLLLGNLHRCLASRSFLALSISREHFSFALFFQTNRCYHTRWTNEDCSNNRFRTSNCIVFRCFVLVLLVFPAVTIIIIIIIIILLKFKFNKFLKLTQPAYSIANRGGLCNLQ